LLTSVSDLSVTAQSFSFTDSDLMQPYGTSSIFVFADLRKSITYFIVLVCLSSFTICIDLRKVITFHVISTRSVGASKCPNPGYPREKVLHFQL
jgi:hypothetical protein